jgi:uncharacterized protein involved in exopolysaccharide biosynthesis
MTATPQWIVNAELFWRERRTILRITACGMLLCLILCFVLPKRYEAATTIMPPEQTGSSAALLAAISQRAGSASGGMSALAGSLFGSSTKGEMFIDLMRSGTVGGALAQQFELQSVYGKRYMVDTIKKLSSRTSISENKKSGLITLKVTDSDPVRARDLASAYIVELNRLLTRVSTSAARRERVSVEQRLQSVQADLQQAQIEMSEFSSKNTAIDIKEQAKATVEAGAKLDAQLIVARAQLASLRQVYGDENPRVLAVREQVGVLEHELASMSGSASAPDDGHLLYPSLRKLPALGVEWANLYRRVRVQETVFELLSAQYEAARIQEAREVGTVSVVDAPDVPEKRSFPKRTLTMVAGTVCSFFAGLFWIVAVENWRRRDGADPLRAAWQRVHSEATGRLAEEQAA